MRFDQLFLDDIRNRVSLSDVVGRRVTWDRRKSQPARVIIGLAAPSIQRSLRASTLMSAATATSVLVVVKVEIISSF